MIDHLRPPALLLSPVRQAIGALCLASLTACGGDDSSPTAAKEVPEWNRIASDVIASAGSPAQQVHGLSVVQIAVHDALNTIDSRHERYAATTAVRDGSAAAAVATATHDTLVRLVPSAQATVSRHYASKLATIGDGAAKTAGIDAGREAATAILSRRAADDLVAATLKAYEPRPPAPGVYRKTPPADVVIGAGFGELSPFAIGDLVALRSPPPPATASTAFATEQDEVRRLGSAVGSARTGQQTETARFWYDAATREWHGAARQVLAARGDDEWQAARVLAAMSIAMFDATVASFDTKFRHEFWRPITAIRDGEHDDNPATAGDPGWQPLCDTPPFPEYNSTHAATGAAAAGVLSRLLGDANGFTVDSPTLAGVTRRYARFTDAAREEGLSRIYCGIHFRSAMDAGLNQGDRVADEVVRTVLRPAASAAFGLSPD